MQEERSSDHEKRTERHVAPLSMGREKLRRFLDRAEPRRALGPNDFFERAPMRRFHLIVGGTAMACLAAPTLFGCSSGNDGGNPPATGGTATGGVVATGGSHTGGAATGGAATGGAATGGAATGGVATGGTTPTGGMATGGTATGGGGKGGAATGGTAAGGRGGSGTPTGGTATGGSATGGAGGSGSVVTGGENSVAYIGCSMAYNIGTGYKRVGGKVMWNSDSYQTSAMVVQNWTDSNSSSWQLFDQKMSSIGGKDKVKAIMVQICIFSSRATDAELKSMVASARKHVNPGTHIYIVGQPQYEAGHECSLAGTGGAKWTDDQAKALAADSGVNQDMTYLGQFKLDSTKGEVQSDSCHASSPSGENALGKQAMAFFGG